MSIQAREYEIDEIVTSELTNLGDEFADLTHRDVAQATLPVCCRNKHAEASFQVKAKAERESSTLRGAI